MRGSCITLYSTFAVKAGVKNSGKTWSPNIIQLTVHPQTPPNTIPHLLGCPWCWLSGLLHTRLHGECAVERYTAHTHPTAPLQSSTAYTAYTALYSVVYYTAIQPIQYTALYNHPLSVVCASQCSRDEVVTGAASGCMNEIT